MRVSSPALGVVVAAVVWMPPLLFGNRWAGYSAVRDYISELGAAGAPDAAAVNATFALTGVLVILLCTAVARGARGVAIAMTLVSAVGWSYVVAAVAPCDAGCPAEGSSTQALHNASGALGYLLGGLGLMAAARPLRAAGQTALGWSGIAAGLVALAGLVVMGAPELAEVRGAAQRLVELAVTAWLVAAAWIVRGATSASSGPRPTSGPA